MIKHFCDICGNEITDVNTMISQTLTTALTNSSKETIMKVVINPANGFSFESEENGNCEVCKYCVLDAIIRLDDRVNDS